MASRYDSLSGGANTGTTETNVQESTQSSTNRNSSSTQTGSSTTDSRSTINEQSQTIFDIDTMSDPGRQALNQLLAQLAAGGTEEQRRLLEEQMNTLQRLRGESEQYSRETALGDAEGLMQQFTRRSLEENMPAILLAGSGAGTSGSAISALLAQDLATRTAEGAASAGVGAVGQYGGILASLLGQEQQLVAGMEDQALASLLEALGIDRGSMQRGSETTNRTATTTGRETTNSRQNSSSSESTINNTLTNRTGTEVKTPNTDTSRVNNQVRRG